MPESMQKQLERLEKAAATGRIPIVGQASKRQVIITLDTSTGNLNITGSAGMNIIEQNSLVDMAKLFLTANFIKATLGMSPAPMPASGEPPADPTAPPAQPK